MHKSRGAGCKYSLLISQDNKGAIQQACTYLALWHPTLFIFILAPFSLPYLLAGRMQAKEVADNMLEGRDAK